MTRDLLEDREGAAERLDAATLLVFGVIVGSAAAAGEWLVGCQAAVAGGGARTAPVPGWSSWIGGPVACWTPVPASRTRWRTSGVRDAIVVGVPEGRFGEMVVAVVEPRWTSRPRTT